MKCPRCKFYNICKGRLNETVENCVRFKSVELTNEEWVKQCTTEQLANVFFEYRYANATPRQKLWMSASEKCIKTDKVEWLKQLHKE